MLSLCFQASGSLVRVENKACSKTLGRQSSLPLGTSPVLTGHMFQCARILPSLKPPHSCPHLVTSCGYLERLVLPLFRDVLLIWLSANALRGLRRGKSMDQNQAGCVLATPEDKNGQQGSHLSHEMMTLAKRASCVGLTKISDFLMW